MNLNPYLTFNGQCAEAFAFYAKVFSGEITFAVKYSDSPMADQTPADSRDRIMHSTLNLGGRILQGADAPPGGYEKPRGISISVSISDTAEAERIYRELSEGAEISMPLQKTFWAERFAMLTDRFGVPWMINCS